MGMQDTAADIVDLYDTIDAKDAKIKALVEALESIEGRIEQAANDFNDATRWPDVAHFMSDCTVMEWVISPARAAIEKTKEAL